LDDPHLLGPARERVADCLARIGLTHLLRAEFQAYHDPGFRRRLFEGHLVCIGRYPDRIVVSLALWLIRPHPEENCNEIRFGHVIVEAATIVIPDVSAAVLLAQPGLACFALGADRGGWSVKDLCRRVVEAMIGEGEASPLAWRAASAIAVARRRYKAWEEAMRQAKVESHLFPEEREMYEVYFHREGRRQGRREGRAEGLQQALITTYRARFGRVPDELERAIEATRIPATLLRWQATFCTQTADEIAAMIRLATSSPPKARRRRAGSAGAEHLGGHAQPG
jgi:hypothetical protein